MIKINIGYDIQVVIIALLLKLVSLSLGPFMTLIKLHAAFMKLNEGRDIMNEPRDNEPCCCCLVVSNGRKYTVLWRLQQTTQVTLRACACASALCYEEAWKTHHNI